MGKKATIVVSLVKESAQKSNREIEKEIMMRAQTTVETYLRKIRKLVKFGVDLYDPESVKDFWLNKN